MPSGPKIRSEKYVSSGWPLTTSTTRPRTSLATE